MARSIERVSALFGRELAAFFLSPTAYFLLLAFQIIAWFNFAELMALVSRPRLSFSITTDPISNYLSSSVSFWIAVMIAVPVLTMRLVAEERRLGTWESLLTAPVTETEIILAKWLAAVVMFLVLQIPHLIYLPFLARFLAIDPGPPLGLVLGLASAALMFSAIGVFFSTLARSQVVAAVWTFLALFGFVLLPQLLYNLGATRQASWLDVARQFAVLQQIHDLGTGRFDPRVPLLHGSVATLFLFLAIRCARLRPFM